MAYQYPFIDADEIIKMVIWSKGADIPKISKGSKISKESGIFASESIRPDLPPSRPSRLRGKCLWFRHGSGKARRTR
jgi:hypothetical protein